MSMSCPRLSHPRILVAAAACLLGASCGSDSTPTDTGGGTPAISVNIQSTSLTIAAGQSGTVGLTLSRSGGFTGVVTFSIDGLPSGWNGLFTPAALPNLGTVGQVTVTAPASAPAGTVDVVIRASGQGVADATANLALTVSAASAASYTLALNPSTLQVAPGGSATAGIAITRSNFTAPITLSVTGAPTGVTAAISPTPATADAATLSIDATASAAPGSYTLTVTGQAQGVVAQTAALTLSVTQPGGGAGSVVWNFCASNAPIWLAYQDGGGAWVELPVSPGAAVPIPISQARGGVAFVVRNTNPILQTHHLTVRYGTVAELQVIGADWCTTHGGGKQVTGTVAGLQASESAWVTMGIASTTVQANQPTFTLNTVPDGAHDLLAARVTSSAAGAVANRYLFRRDIDPADGATLPVIDFNSSEAFDPVTHSVTLGNAGGATVFTGLTYTTGDGTISFLSGVSGAGATLQYPGVPAAHQQAGDLHILTASVQTGLQTRGSTVYFHDAADRTLAIGPPLATATVTTDATSPYVRLQAQLPVQSEYDQQIGLQITQTLGNTAAVTGTAAYFGSLPADWLIALPDLTSAGFDPAWGPQPSGPIVWGVSAFGWDAAGAPILAPFDGFVSRYAISGGGIVP